MDSGTFLRPDVWAAPLGADLVLLDIAADRYLCAPDGALALAIGHDGEVRGAADAAQALVDAGLAKGAHMEFVRAPPAPDLPTRDLRGGRPPGLSPRAAGRFLLCLFDLLRLYRGRTFAQILEAARRPPRSARARPQALELAETARLAQAALIWLPLSRKCLVRSFLVLRFLQRSGHTAQWVFGVRTWPFAAHCWLQSGDLVLDDLPERLAAYRPICAV